VRSKADISQLNLPHGTDNEKVGKEDEKVEMDMLRAVCKYNVVQGICRVSPEEEKKDYAQWLIQDFCKGGAAAGAFGVPQAPSCPLSLRPLRKNPVGASCKVKIGNNNNRAVYCPHCFRNW